RRWAHPPFARRGGKPGRIAFLWLKARVRPARIEGRNGLAEEQALSDGAQHERDEYPGYSGRQAQGDARGDQNTRNRSKEKSGQHVEVYVAQERVTQARDQRDRQRMSDIC